jgi:hypothetical protein
MEMEIKKKAIIPIPRFALCLARSYDSIAVKNKYAHLLYSAYKFPLGEDFNTKEFIQRVIPFQEYYSRNEEFQIQKKVLNSNFYIFRLKAFDLNLDSDMRLGDRFIKTINERKNYDYKVICNGIVLEVSLPLMSLLCEKNIYLYKNYMFNLLEKLIGNISDENKKMNDLWLSHSIFIFEGFTSLYAIIELFKSFNIHLSPGGIPSRGALSTIQANLHAFLLYSANLLPFENKMVFKSYEHIAFSKNISFKSKNKKKLDQLVKYWTELKEKHGRDFGKNEVNNIVII